MFKNVASQKIALYAFDATVGMPKTGDAANLTAYVSKDHGAVTALTDTTATEIDSTNAKGWYLWDLTQTETNADALLFTAKSSTSNVVVVGQPIQTIPQAISTLDAAGVRSAVGLASANLDTQLTAIDDYLDTEVAAIKAKTDNLPASPAAVSDIPTAAANAAAVLTATVEGSTTVVQSMRLANAALGGKASGLATATAVYRDIGDTKDRITATVDASGNRTAVTRDLS